MSRRTIRIEFAPELGAVLADIQLVADLAFNAVGIDCALWRRSDASTQLVANLARGTVGVDDAGRR